MQPVAITEAPATDCSAAVPTEVLDCCPLCSGSKLAPFARSFDRLHRVNGQRFEYATCQTCGVVFQSTRPVAGAIGAYYPKDYGPYKPTANSTATARPLAARAIVSLSSGVDRFCRVIGAGWRRLLGDSFDEANRQVYALPKEGGALLDFGCGSDKFLNRARKLGWNTTGVDFSPVAVEQAQRSGHRAILISPAGWELLEDNHFDLVRMNHVLEHLYDPREVLAQLWTKIRPGGRLHIAIPNPRSLSARVFKSKWFSLDCPRHIMLFSPACAQRLLQSVGFVDVTVMHETTTKDMARSIVYALHDAGLAPHNWVQQAIHSHLLDALLYLPVRAGAVLGQGERIHLVCAKPASEARGNAKRAA